MTCPTGDDFETLKQAWDRKFLTESGSYTERPYLAFTFYEGFWDETKDIEDSRRLVPLHTPGVERKAASRTTGARCLIENYDGSMFDRRAGRYFSSIEEWYTDVRPANGDYLLPLAELRFGPIADTDSVLEAHEIEDELGWTHRPLTVPRKKLDAPAAAPAPAPAAATAPAPAPTAAAGGAGAGASTSAKKVTAKTLIEGWLNKNKITEWSPAVKRKMNKAGLEDGWELAKALLIVRAHE